MQRARALCRRTHKEASFPVTGANQVSPASRPRWLLWFGLGCGLAAVIASFLTWTSVSAETYGSSPLIGAAANVVEAESGSAWESLPAVGAVLLLVTACVVAITARRLAWFALSGAAVALIVVDWATLPDVRELMQAVADRFGVAQSTIQTSDVIRAEGFINIEPGVGLYLGLTLAVISLTTSLLAGKISASK